MMNTSNLESNSASQKTNASSQPLPGAAVPTFPLPGAGVPTFNYAIALQQYQFQQSLVNRQLLAQQQAVAHAVSIKAAAEQAAARAAEISRLLKGETDNLVKEKSEELSPKREKPESKSHPQSPSVVSSKSNSISPIKYRNSRREHEQYSPRDRSNYRTSRYSSYYSRYDDRRGYSRSSYRRDEDRLGGRSYSYYRGNWTTRSRRRSPSKFRSSRYHRYDSFSPQRRRVRSPSPKSGHKISSRVSNRHSRSKSPINSSSSSPRKPIARSLSSSENSPSPSTTSLLVKENKVNHNIISSEDNNASDLDVNQREKEAKPFRQKLVMSGSSNSSRLESTSTDYSGERNIEGSSLKKSVSGKFVSASGDHSSSASSHGLSIRSALHSRDDESDIAVSVLPRSTDDMDNPRRMLNHRPSRDDGKGRKLRDSLMERRLDEDHTKPTSVSRPSHSTGDFLSDLGDHGQKKFSDERKKNKDADKYVVGERYQSKEPPPKVINCNKGSACYEDREKDDRRKVKNDRGNGSDVITVEDDVDDNNHSTKGGCNFDPDLCEHPDIPGECAIYPLPEANESTDGKELVVNSLVMLPDGVAEVDAELVSMTPNVSQYPEKGYKLSARSKERRRKHSKRDHKRRERVESEEEDDYRKKSRKEGKLKRHERKGHRRLHKSHNERKRGKRKHHDTSSSSSSEDLCKKDYCNVPSKGSMGSRKKRRSSPAASTSSS